MSDNESVAAPPAHPSFGGKSIETVQQQQNMLMGERKPYKSWRKKYRKMRVRFDAAFEENRLGFRQEHKLESTARRLREELDELLEILLDLNDSPAIPPALRFDVRLASKRSKPSAIPPNLTPDASNNLMHEYTNAVKAGRIPHLDLQIIRDEIQSQLAAQDTTPIETLEASVPHPSGPTAKPEKNPSPAYLTTEAESTYLSRIDASLGDPLALDKTAQQPPWPHHAELTPRELERHMELLNPQSQHNWLKTHTKQVPSLGLETDDNESQHEAGGGKATPSGRGKGKGRGNLAKQVGDRAVERAGYGEAVGSPGGFGSGFEEEGEGGGLAGFVEEFPGAGGRKKKDVDGAYRVKGGKAAGTGKRKRKTDEGGQMGVGKKPRMSEGVGE